MAKLTWLRFVAVCTLVFIISCEEITNTDNVQNQPTEIILVSPEDNSIISAQDSLQIYAYAEDIDTIVEKMELFLNNNLIFTSMSQNLNYNCNFSEFELGKKDILIKAYDNMDRIDSLLTIFYVESNLAMSLSESNIFYYEKSSYFDGQLEGVELITKYVIDETYDGTLRYSEIKVITIYENGSSEIYYENLSTDINSVYTDNQETLYNLNWTNGSNNVIETGELTVFGRNKEYIKTRIDSQFGEMWSFSINTYLKTFGLTTENHCFFDGYNYLETETILKGAIIDGKQYGEIGN